MAGIYEEKHAWMLQGGKRQQNQRITGEVEAATATEAQLEATLSRLHPNRDAYVNTFHLTDYFQSY